MKPEKRTKLQSPRPRSARLTISAASARPAVLVPDTCAYIHAAAGRLPPAARLLLGTAIQYHCAACLGEIAAGIGNMSPMRADYRAVRAHYAGLMAAIPAGRVLVPNERDWLDAGLLAGALARSQKLQAHQRKEPFNDALIYVCAARAGLPVLTNDEDFDLLQQVLPQGAVIFY